MVVVASPAEFRPACMFINNVQFIVQDLLGLRAHIRAYIELTFEAHIELTSSSHQAHIGAHIEANVLEHRDTFCWLFLLLLLT